MTLGNADSGKGRRPVPRTGITQARQPPIVAADGGPVHQTERQPGFALPPNNPNATSSTAPTVMAESATLKAGYDHACQ